MEWLWLTLLGLGAGAFGVAVGVGGGIIMVPVLLLFSDIDTGTVAGTSLALVSVNSFSGTAAYYRLRLVDRRSGLLFAAAAIPGSVVAPFAVDAVDPSLFRTLFGVLLVGLAAHMIVDRVRRRVADEVPSRSRLQVRKMRATRCIDTGDGQLFRYEFNEGLATGFNAILGFVSAFLGTGGGFLRTPVLVTAFGFPVRIAVATSIFALSIYASAGSAIHAVLGHLDWYPTFLWAGVGFLVGSQVGARLSSRLPTEWILRLLIVLLLTMGVRLLMQAAGV